MLIISNENKVCCICKEVIRAGDPFRIDEREQTAHKLCISLRLSHFGISGIPHSFDSLKYGPENAPLPPIGAGPVLVTEGKAEPKYSEFQEFSSGDLVAVKSSIPKSVKGKLVLCYLSGLASGSVFTFWLLKLLKG